MENILYVAQVDDTDGNRVVLCAYFDRNMLDVAVKRIEKLSRRINFFSFGHGKLYDFKTLVVDEYMPLVENDPI